MTLRRTLQNYDLALLPLVRELYRLHKIYNEKDATMPMYRKKPVAVEAHQWFKNGDHPLDNVYRPFSDGTPLVPCLPAATTVDVPITLESLRRVRRALMENAALTQTPYIAFIHPKALLDFQPRVRWTAAWRQYRIARRDSGYAEISAQRVMELFAEPAIFEATYEKVEP